MAVHHESDLDAEGAEIFPAKTELPKSVGSKAKFRGRRGFDQFGAGVSCVTRLLYCPCAVSNAEPGATGQ